MKKKKEPKEKKVGYGQMLKVFLRSVREYKKDSILAALFITFETVFECVIPFVMSMLLTFMEKSEGYILNQTMTEGEAMATVGYYSLGLIALAFCSFGCGYTAAKVSAKAAVGYHLHTTILYVDDTYRFESSIDVHILVSDGYHTIS